MRPGTKLSRDRRDPGPLPRDYEPPYATWTKMGNGRGEVIYNAHLNARLRANDVIRISKTRRLWFSDNPTARELAKVWPLRRGVKDETKIRLSSDIDADSQEVRLEPTKYASFIVTNKLADMEVYRDGVRALRLEDVIVRTSTGLVRRFSDSNASNHLGGDVLAVAPGRAFIQAQGPAVEVDPLQRVASGSGSFDLADMRWTRDLVTLAKNGLLRELREELGLGRWSRKSPRREDVKIIGFSRATYLGGKPQFYAVARIPSSARPRVRRAEHKWIGLNGKAVEFDPDTGVQGLLEALLVLRRDVEVNLSNALIALIGMIELWVEADPAAEAWLFGRHGN
jgi:hypothetical protein